MYINKKNQWKLTVSDLKGNMVKETCLYKLINKNQRIC